MWITSTGTDSPLCHSATVLSSASCIIDALLAGLHLQVFDVPPVIFENLPNWNIPLDTFFQGFSCPRKSDILPTHLRTLFSEHVDLVHTNHAIMYTDGSNLQEQVGCAAVFAGECVGRWLWAESTVFTAELTAIRGALIIASNTQDQTYTIFSDSHHFLSPSIKCEWCGTGASKWYKPSTTYGSKIHPTWTQLLTENTRMQEKTRRVWENDELRKEPEE